MPILVWYTVRGTSGNVHDVLEGNSLLHGQEVDAYGDAGYQGIHKRPDANSLQDKWHVAMHLKQTQGVGQKRSGRSADRQD